MVKIFSSTLILIIVGCSHSIKLPNQIVILDTKNQVLICKNGTFNEITIRTSQNYNGRYNTFKYKKNLFIDSIQLNDTIDFIHIKNNISGESLSKRNLIGFYVHIKVHLYDNGNAQQYYPYCFEFKINKDSIFNLDKCNED